MLRARAGSSAGKLRRFGVSAWRRFGGRRVERSNRARAAELHAFFDVDLRRVEGARGARGHVKLDRVGCAHVSFDAAALDDHHPGLDVRRYLGTVPDHERVIPANFPLEGAVDAHAPFEIELAL